MSNKQINELQELNPEDFEPGKDKFIVQRNDPADKSTYSSTIAEMINNGSAELPGSTDWEWKFLDEPATILGFQSGGSKAEDQGSSFTPKKIYFNDINVSTDINGKPTGVPQTAQNFLCVVCSRNVSFSFLAPRGEIVQYGAAGISNGFTYIDANMAKTAGYGTLGAFIPNDIKQPVIEQIFAVENISWPQNNKVNVTSSEEPSYREAGKIHCTVQPRSMDYGGIGWGTH
jgi:hypothetical protein